MYKQLYPFYGSIFFQHLAYGLLIPVLIIWQHQNGLSFVEIGLIQSIGFALILISEVPSSYFADHVGKKSTSLIGLLFALLSFFVLTQATAFLMFAIAQALLSLGLSFLSGTEEALLHDIVHNKESRLTHYLGRMSISDEMGTIVGMLISSILITQIGVVSSFKAGIVSILVAFLLLLPIQAKTKSATEVENHKKLSAKNLTFGLFLFVLAFSFMAERGQMLFQNRFDEFGISLGSFGLVYVFAKLFSILGSSVSHSLEEKLKSNSVFLLSALLQIIAFVLLLSLSKWVAIVALGIFFFAENIFRNVQKSVVLKNVDHNKRATALSLVSFSSSIFLIVFQPVLGLGLDVKFFYAVMAATGLKLIASLIFLFRVKS